MNTSTKIMNGVALLALWLGLGPSTSRAEIVIDVNTAGEYIQTPSWISNTTSGLGTIGDTSVGTRPVQTPHLKYSYYIFDLGTVKEPIIGAMLLLDVVANGGTTPGQPITINVGRVSSSPDILAAYHSTSFESFSTIGPLGSSSTGTYGSDRPRRSISRAKASDLCTAVRVIPRASAT